MGLIFLTIDIDSFFVIHSKIYFFSILFRQWTILAKFRFDLCNSLFILLVIVVFFEVDSFVYNLCYTRNFKFIV